MANYGAQKLRSTKSAEIRVKSVETQEEWQRCADVMADEHATNQPARRWLISHSEQYPNYRREHTRIALAGDDVAGAVRITTDTIRIGEARLKMGGIGWLTVADRFRRKGVASLLIADAQAYMRAHNYHVSMLFGIPNFYEKFGYATALVDHSILIDATEARGFHTPFRMRLARPSDITSLQKIHNNTDSDTTCSLLRSSAHFKNRWMRFADWRLLSDEQGRILAYLYPRAEYGSLNVIEIGLSDPSLKGALLGAAGEMAFEQSLPQIRFFVPPRHAFARYMQQFRTIHETRYENNAGGMMAFVDILEALENMIPEWESRLQQSHEGELRCEVTFVVDRKNISLRSNRGAVDVAARSTRHKIALKSQELLHLVIGYRRVDDLLETKPILLPPEIRQLLATIFPARTPFVWPYDRF
jgi:predicted acetyltransferase